ncbi:DUF721 domain-containing protein [uncultured Megasphaera sp.]|uniref:DUF721 domain-containing protein n=1 Tax=uncultured Megasphaera sp. TaxID=165188 RepID=UPI0025939183|nr:DUF721 domain-containing protein [uncultured Megasphaera sp.]
MNHKKGTLEPVGVSLADILEKNHLAVPLKIFLLKKDWQKVAGEQIAAFSYVQKLHGFVLYIGVLNSVWMQHLFMYKQKLIQNINQYLEEAIVKDIRFVHSGKEKTSSIYSEKTDRKTSSVSIKNQVLSKEIVDKIQRETSHVIPELRDIIRKVRYTQEKKIQAYRQMGIKKCPKCGNWLDPGEKICLFCRLQERHEFKYKIRRIILSMPWISLEECITQGYVPQGCNSFTELYNEVRRDCIYQYIEKIHFNVDTSEDDLVLALLITRYKPTEITDEFVQRLTEKYRQAKKSVKQEGK